MTQGERSGLCLTADRGSPSPGPVVVVGPFQAGLKAISATIARVAMTIEPLSQRPSGSTSSRRRASSPGSVLAYEPLGVLAGVTIAPAGERAGDEHPGEESERRDEPRGSAVNVQPVDEREAEPHGHEEADADERNGGAGDPQHRGDLAHVVAADREDARNGGHHRAADEEEGPEQVQEHERLGAHAPTLQDRPGATIPRPGVFGRQWR